MDGRRGLLMVRSRRGHVLEVVGGSASPREVRERRLLVARGRGGGCVALGVVGCVCNGNRGHWDRAIDCVRGIEYGTSSYRGEREGGEGEGGRRGREGGREREGRERGGREGGGRK